jgi:hypothetical protein
MTLKAGPKPGSKAPPWLRQWRLGKPCLTRLEWQLAELRTRAAVHAIMAGLLNCGQPSSHRR